MTTRSLRRALLPGAMLALLLPARAAPTQARIDGLIDTLFQPADFERVALSPDGSHLALTREFQDHKVLVTVDLKTNEMHSIRQSHRSDVGAVNWSGPDSLLISMTGYIDEGGGYYRADENLVSVKHIDEKRREYFGLIQTLPWDGKGALFTRFEEDESRFSPLYRLNLKTGAFTLIEDNPGRVLAWHVDPATGIARLATAAGIATNPADPKQPAKVAAGQKGEISTLFRKTPSDPWRAIETPKEAVPVYFDPSGQSVLLSYLADTGRRVLQNYDLATGQLVGRVVGDPRHDIDPDPLIDPLTAVPRALGYSTEKPEFLWLNPEYQQIHALLQASFPGQTILLEGPSGKNKMVFVAGSDTQPSVVYEFDAAERKVTPLITARPAAMDKPWAKMTPLWFTARDGYQVPAYLTLPPDRKPGQKLPMIALSHGGPRVRDKWGFNPEVQFLAALGYAVLQVNYRGSEGFGATHVLANELLVHERSVDDVADGLRWAVAAGYADPKRLVAYGGSYGGYISLALATRYPELIAAAVGFAGVYDWEAQREKESTTHRFVLKWRADYYLDPKKYADKFREFSPVRFASQVRCPVLLTHGNDDSTVDIEQSRKMNSALKQAGKSVEFVKDVEGIHGLPHAKERTAFYHTIADFLLKNVPPDN